MKNYTAPIVLALIAIFKITDCTRTCLSDRSSPGQDVNLAVLSDSQLKFTLKLNKEMVKDSKLNGSNIFTCPYSLWNALTLTYIGARKTSSNVLGRVLELQGFDKAKLDTQFQNLKSQLMSSSKSSVLKIANSIAFDNSITLKSCVKCYVQDVQNLDFRGKPQNSMKKLNEWIGNATNNNINDFFSSNDIASDTLIVILSAVFFEGNWKNRFDPRFTRDNPFRTSSGSTVQVPMMYNDERYEYVYDSQMSAVRLPYADEKYEMILMLPNNPNENIERLVERLTPEKIKWVVKNMKTRYVVRLWLPKLNLTCSYNLNRILTNFGAGEIFNNVNLAAFIQSSPVVKISKVLHKAFINIHEQGSVAAAGTGITGIQVSIGHEKEMRFNRPFVFMIREKTTGIILFTGVVRHP